MTPNGCLEGGDMGCVRDILRVKLCRMLLNHRNGEVLWFIPMLEQVNARAGS